MKRALLAAFVSLPVLLAAQGPPVLDSAAIGDVRARALGPAVTSGRIAAIDGVADNPRILYVGSAGGGVWKSMNGGETFAPVFDEHPMSIGAVTVDQNKPDTVWVGTGEAWTRNSVSVGKGVYKSTDAGRTWTAMGLADTEHIAAIAVRPKRSDTVFTCALGHLWNGNDERGVFKTTDGGKTWKKVLFVNADTGCADIDVDPQEPDVMYAAMWQVRRLPYFFTSGGPGSGLYKSTDGGDHWKKITAGLPDGDLGRIAVGIAPSRSGTVYALVESRDTKIYRSDDSGESWRPTSEGKAFLPIRTRPFYFANVVVDPTDHTRVYNPSLFLSLSQNGGRTFEPLFLGAGVHSDTHALWINPKDPYTLVLGTDGGVYISRDRGVTWAHTKTLPVAQLYHVTYDMQRPYHVYAGLQDNGSWTAPSRAIAGTSIRSGDWTNIGIGDGFNAFPDPRDSTIVYSEYQGAQVRRYHRQTGEIKDIRPRAAAGEPLLRFNWNAAFTPGTIEPGTLYLGGQYVFRSRDRGDSWQRISPDLTTNDPDKQHQRESGGITKDNSTAENHCTIVTIAPSPLDAQVIWAGTDDGNVQLTRDGGRTWTNVVSNVSGVPAHTWVSGIEAGRHQKGTAFVTFDGHRTGDMKTYLYATDDFGRTWRPLMGSGLDGYLHVMRQDLVNPSLLLAGSEAGLFVSVDAGAHWARLTGGLPAVAVYDMTIHPRDHDLILATHGRGVQIVDDITPLRHLTPETLAKKAAILPARLSVQRIPATLQDFPGDAEFAGPNPAEGAVITYYLKQRHVFGKLRLDVLDSGGTVVKSLPAGARQGINRVYWNMRLDPPKSASAPGLGARALAGPMVAEGRYTVRLTIDDEAVTGTVELAPDPIAPHPPADRQLRQTVVMQLYTMQNDLAYLGDASALLRDDAKARAAGVKDKTAQADLVRALDAFAAGADMLNDSLVDRTGGLVEGDPKLRERVIDLYGAVLSFAGRPTVSQQDYASVLAGELKEARARFGELSGSALQRVNDLLMKAGEKPVAVPPSPSARPGSDLRQ
jgi:photosystem II stability/assembly factor-like uncharacterized protein